MRKFRQRKFHIIFSNLRKYRWQNSHKYRFLREKHQNAHFRTLLVSWTCKILAEVFSDLGVIFGSFGVIFCEVRIRHADEQIPMAISGISIVGFGAKITPNDTNLRLLHSKSTIARMPSSDTLNQNRLKFQHNSQTTFYLVLNP